MASNYSSLVKQFILLEMVINMMFTNSVNLKSQPPAVFLRGLRKFTINYFNYVHVVI